MHHKVVTNPVTGRMETILVDDAGEAREQADLARAHRELRDILAGNTPFHDDKLGPGKAAGGVGVDMAESEGGLTWAVIPEDEWDNFLVECKQQGRVVVYTEYNPLRRVTWVQTVPVAAAKYYPGV